ncbi:MAG: hypothetical protein B6U72_01195 [Candidatus Altiarchaeales archaeon ex4484_2]|nr:MAG: hypothetical protein B6U72_01195 [Candidatus Altiarchaeales archaeon ex4484_2]
MKFLVYEYFSSGGLPDQKKSLLMEGLCMLNLIVDGLRREKHHVYSVIGELNNIGGDVVVLEKQMDPASFLMEKVDELGVDYVYPIAPDRELAVIASTLKGEVDAVCSEPDALEKAADKWQTYILLKKKGLRQPETFKDRCPKKNFLVKPRYGVGCEGVSLNSGTSRESINQEYIKGTDASVSVFSDGRNSKAVSLNKQHITRTGNILGYSGGVVPLSHPLSDDAFILAEKAVNSIKGLKGCVGVDMVLSDEPYIIEINPRVTTSMAALEQAADFNVAASSLEAYKGNLPKRPEFKSNVEFNLTDEGISFFHTDI